MKAPPTQGMEMPCFCDKCGDVFDLYSGTSYKGIVYCESCGDKMNEVHDLQYQIDGLNIQLENATKRESKAFLKKEIKELQAKLVQLLNE